MVNSFFNEYPYTDFHELNLSWVVKELRTFATTLDQFVSINALKYADPIQWDITRQYEKNTIVIDPITGTAYISTQAVPSGVALTNTDYWTIVFDLGSFVVKTAKNFCTRYEEATTLTATFPSSVNDWLIWGDTLYYALSNIIAGDTYVVDSNIKQFTVEDVVGHIQDLNTTDKSNLISAINEILVLMGNLDNLNTNDKTSIVNAVNEVLHITKNNPYINVKSCGAVGDGVTNDTTAFITASTLAGANTPIYVPTGVYLVDYGLSLNNQLLVDHDVEIIDSNGISMLIRPSTNDYNLAIAFIKKYTGEFRCPPAATSITDINEMLDDDSRMSFTISGSINANVNRINTSDNTANIHLGDGIISSVDPIFSNTNPNLCMRVIEIGDNYIDFAPDKGDASGIGQDPYSYTGGNLSGTFTIRPRYWSCPSYNGVRTGREQNPDKVHWCGNDVAWTRGQRVIGREIDVLVMDTVNQECNGLLVTGQKWYPSNIIGVNAQMGGTLNGNVGFSSRNYDIGYFSNAWTSFIFDPTYYDNITQSNIAVAGGIIQSDYGDYISIRPSIAVKQIVNGSVCIAVRRNTDTNPTGFIMRVMSADDLTQLFGIDVLGNMSANDITCGNLNVLGNITNSGTFTADNLASNGNITAIGDVTANDIGANNMTAQVVHATTAGWFKDIRIDQTATAGSVTPNSYITLYDANNNPVQVPVYDPNI